MNIKMKFNFFKFYSLHFIKLEKRLYIIFSFKKKDIIINILFEIFLIYN